MYKKMIENLKFVIRLGLSSARTKVNENKKEK